MAALFSFLLLHRQADLLLEGDAFLHATSFGANCVESTFAVICKESAVSMEGGKIFKSSSASSTLVDNCNTFLIR